MTDLLLMNVDLIGHQIGETFGRIGSAIMWPLYWAVSGILVGAHWLWGHVFDPDSGLTWFLTIASLTVVVRTLMLPLYQKQLNSSRAMQALQPKIKELQEKYGHDRMRLGEETQKLYQEEGINPAASCLPLLVQLPIFWALFRVLRTASGGEALGYWFEKYPQSVESLSNATLFGAELSGTFWPWSDGFGANQIMAIILTLLMTGILFMQQRLMIVRNMPPETLEGPMGQQQKMMMYMMPAMFIFAGLTMPLGVLVYWLTSNIWTFGQQWIIMRTYPTPGTSAYIAWEDRMIANGKDPKQIERQRADKARGRSTKPNTSTDSTGKPQVARQKDVNRDTVRKEADGKKVVERRQVERQSRAARKKKK